MKIFWWPINICNIFDIYWHHLEAPPLPTMVLERCTDAMLLFFGCIFCEGKWKMLHYVQNTIFSLCTQCTVCWTSEILTCFCSVIVELYLTWWFGTCFVRFGTCRTGFFTFYCCLAARLLFPYCINKASIWLSIYLSVAIVTWVNNGFVCNCWVWFS